MDLKSGKARETLGLFGFLVSLLLTLLWLAFLGWLFYLVIKVLSPATADRIRETMRGRQAA